MRRTLSGRVVTLTLAALLVTGTGAAATHQVGSLTDLQARIDAAAPGDIIILKDGRYTTATPITVRRQGAPGKPIRIAAQTQGKVEIAGSDGFDVVSPASHVEIEGFVFTHASGKTQIRPRRDACPVHAQHLRVRG